MYKKLFGFVLLFIGLSLLQGVYLAFTNTEYTLEKSMLTGIILFILAIYPTFKGVKLLLKAKDL